MRAVSKSETLARRAALKRFINLRGLKIKPWCERAGVPPTAVYNFLNGYSDSLEEETYRKLAESEGVPVMLLKTDYPIARVAYAIPVIGAVQAGVWAEAMEWERDQRYVIAATIPERYAKKAYGLLMEGPSMNMVYPDGSIAICVRLMDFDRDLRDRDRVVVERRRHDGMIEATVKELVIDGDGAGWLWPRSSDPRYQQPLSLADPNGEADTVEVTAVVIGSYRPEPNID